jgi:hypothetical protein
MQQITKCSYCSKYEIRPGKWGSYPPDKQIDPKEITHGICPDCLKKVFKEEGLEAA